MRMPRALVLSAGLGLAAAAVALPNATAAPVPATDPGGPSSATSHAVATAAVAPATATRPRHRRTKAIMPTRRTKLAPGSATAPMTYHGGRLMTAPARVYLVWYGDWSAKPAVPLLTDLVRGFGGSAYARTNTGATDAGGHHVTSDVRYGGSVVDDYSHGHRLTDAGVKAVVRRAVTTGHLPVDVDGIYVVLTSADVHETSGFGSGYCGWHSHATIAASDLKYVFVGDPTTQAPRTCVAPLPSLPVGDLASDAMASTVVHEIDETLTDPDLDGWYDRWFNENGDKCAWTYGPLRRTASGASTNVRLGGHDLLIQRNWVVATTQGCAMAA
jgi:hypothetical protein